MSNPVAIMIIKRVRFGALSFSLQRMTCCTQNSVAFRSIHQPIILSQAPDIPKKLQKPSFKKYFRKHSILSGPYYSHGKI